MGINMAIMEKLGKIFRRSEEPVSGSRRVIPEERELQSYLEEERQKKIKKLANYYRMKRARDTLMSGGILESKNVLKQKNIFK